jgi:hypothetical protein
VEWPVTTLGILGAILINIGLVAPFIDASKRDWRIIGISFRFLCIDFSGAVFSLLSLCFQETLDRYAAGSYITVMVLETGICLVQCSWIVRKWSTIKEARKEGKTFDEFVGEEEVSEKKENAEVLRSCVGPRDWRGILSLSGMFAAINRRHGEEKSVSDVEKGATASTEERDDSQVVVTHETCEVQEPQAPPSIYTPNCQTRRDHKGVHDYQPPNSCG